VNTHGSRRTLIPLATLAILLLSACAVISSPPPGGSLCASPGAGRTGLDEQRFVTVGGIEQWLTIKGDDCSNPAVLFVHGGPGNPLSPYAGAIYAGWEKEFTLVQWDQRGAGKTFARNLPLPGATLTIEEMTRDGIGIAETVSHLLGKKKIIITGGSWGSVLAVHMIRSRPDLFHGYVGVSQLVSKVENLEASYVNVLALARAAGDTATITTLESLGAPPWKNPRHFGVLRRATRVYEKKTATPAPAGWWVPAPDYATATFATDSEAAEDYSFLQYVGMNDDGMLARVDLRSLGSRFDVPMYFVHGDEDLVTVKDVATRYFHTIEAPAKEFIAVPAAGHDPNQPLIDAQLNALRKLRARVK
jgi:pimeloyl-ACP methyl ester carboxylesterase